MIIFLINCYSYNKTNVKNNLLIKQDDLKAELCEILTDLKLITLENNNSFNEK